MIAILSCLILLYVVPTIALMLGLCRRAALADAVLEAAGSRGGDG